MKTRLAFSLIELSIVIIVIGILVIGITKGSRVINEARLKSAAALTSSSPVTSIPDLSFWLETTNQENLKTSAVADIATTDYGDLENNDNISAWRDRNPQDTNKIVIVASTDDKRPTYVTDGINNLPTISFDSANSQTLTSTTNMAISEGNDSYTLIAVYMPTDVSTNSYVVSQSTNDTNNEQGSIRINDSTTVGFNGYNNNYFPHSVSNNQNYISVIRINNDLANNATIYLNGSSSTGATGSPSDLNIGVEDLSIGSRNDDTIFFEGFISEIIIYDRALNSKEIDAINSYLSTKYSITLS